MFQVTDGHAIRTSCGGISALFKVESKKLGVKGDRSEFSGCFWCNLRINLRVPGFWLWFEFEVNWAAEMFGYVLMGCVGFVFECDRLV